MGASIVRETNVQLANRNAWVSLYSDYILTRLNDTRSYVVAGIRRSAFDIMNDRTKDNANMTGLLAWSRCLVGWLMTTREDNVFVWYVSEVLTR
jgi:hypothetical protein